MRTPTLKLNAALSHRAIVRDAGERRQRSGGDGKASVTFSRGHVVIDFLAEGLERGANSILIQINLQFRGVCSCGYCRGE